MSAPRLQTFPIVAPPQLARVGALPVRYVGGVRGGTDGLVWHTTAGASAVSSVEWMNRWGPTRAEQGWGSYHAIIERDGTLLTMVPLDRIAYHAGLSALPTKLLTGGVAPKGSSLNGRYLGVSFANRERPRGDPAYEAITEAQLATAEQLVLWLRTRFPRVGDITHHYRHRDIAPTRRSDPSPAVLDWNAFMARIHRALRNAPAASRT